jgi:hypothetical protein
MVGVYPTIAPPLRLVNKAARKFVMKTLLRNTTTGFYLEGKDNWTALAERARDFKSTERLIRFLRDSGVNTMDLELLLCFDDPRYNISLPIDERFEIYTAVPGTEVPRMPEKTA